MGAACPVGQSWYAKLYDTIRLLTGETISSAPLREIHYGASTIDVMGGVGEDPRFVRIEARSKHAGALA